MPITLKLLALVESGDVKYSIKENVKNKVSGEIYDKVVVLDTNIFKGIPPRNWGKTFRNFISKHLTGKKFLIFDENGKEEIIEFAKPNERVTKNGANNSHKVIDKLSRKSDRNSKLVIVHSDEVINISEKQNENAEHSHQWLDENGWKFRNAFVMDKYGKLYSVTLNIAKSKDGRNILYDINKINEVGYGDVLSNAKGKRSSHINPNFVTNSISQSENNINTKNNTDKGVDIKYSISDDVIKKFEIENINDYVHVQKQVLSTLNAENFFDDEGGKSKTVINKDSGMVIVINKKGIKETFNNKNYFNYSRNLKLAKLASIRKIPELIENGKLILDDEKNYHRNNSSIKYAYIVCETKINGKNANIKITVRKSPQNNKFWVHHIYIEKGTERTSAGTSKSSKTAFIPFGATNSISQSENNVNKKNDESGNDIKYSMGGLKAETSDKSALEKAMELEKDGTDSEKIRKETGWFKGYDGKWRFEIDDSELEFKTDIEKNRAAAIELAKMKVKSAELEEKIVNNTATKAEENEYYNLDEKMIEYRKGVKLSDVINHPKLFEAYPQLKNVDVYYEISSVNRGVYSSNGNVIMLNPMHTIDEQKEAIIHEIQHAIQGIENFANGSNLEYWKNLGYSDEEAMAMYYNTAGEREARDVSARRDYNAEQRKNIRPDIDRKDVVFANSGDAGYSADENIMQNDFEEKVDQIENNTYNSNDVVIMGKTPKILQDIGLNSLPVAMTKNHIYSVAVSEARAKSEGRYKKNTNYHNLGFNAVKQIYNKISDPLMIIAHPDFTNKASRDSAHKVIVLVDLSVNNKQVIAPILVDYESIYSKKRMDVNLVATYFNKNNINDLIKEAIALENNNQVGFYYLDKKRTQSIIKRTGYQLPRRLNNLSSNIIIRKIDSNVNKKINKITQSKQFVRWFGDWQNSPKSASKVVDGKGEPLVVYHQTENDFNVFDANKKGAGEFDSEMPTGIFMKPTNSNIGLSGNKQMALYANIRNPLTVNNRAELVRFYEQNIDGYKEARDYISSIDSEYKQKYEQAEAEEDAEYSKLWTAREQGKITEDEYQKAIESNALDELEEEWHNKVNEASKKAKSLIDDYFKTSKYDGVIVKNDAGSFGRTTKTYIAFNNTQVKSATDNIGTFDGKNPDIRYAIDDTKSSVEKYSENDFENKVDQIENNTYNSDDVVIMGRTPKVLQDIGFNSLPVAMTKNHIYSVAVSEARAKNEGRYKQNTNYHDLGFNTVKQIYNKISDPLMVIAHPDFTNKESRDSTHKVIALVDLSVNNKQVIAPILVDYESIYSKKRMDVNLVATYFNKNNINDLIKEAIALENNNQVGFYYLDKKRTQSIIKRTGYQLPRRLNNLSSNIIIRKIDSNVNKKINKITQSQQFVRWFGDWQNKPKTASKVVDGKGEPLVVYHQTGNDFTVFDTKHTGAGEFDSEMPAGIFMKPTSDNIGLSGNKQMALYANIRNPFIANSRKELVDFYIKNIDGYSDAKNEVKRIDSEYKQKFQDEMKRENQEYQKLWVARKNGEISEEEYQKAVSREALDDLLEEWHNKVNEASKKAKSLIDDYFRSSNYDGVIVNNDVGSFGRSTKTYIAFENTQVKSATDNIGTFYGENPDIRYTIDDTKQEEVDFRKALTREEWASFYSSLNKYNQRDNLRIGDNSILIPDDNNAYNYKLVCYRTDKNNIRVKNVYLIENYDYNIHSNEINVLQILSDYEGEEYSEKQTRAILQNYTGMYGTLFKRYNSVSRKFVKLTRESVSNRRNIKETADGAGAYENSEREVSGELSEDKIPDIRYATDDTLNYWLDDLPEGIDYEKVVEKNPVVAVAKIYNSASKTAESGLRQSQNVRLEEKDYLRIADKIMDKYGIKGKYNPNYKQELAEQLTGFIEHIGEKGSNFTDVFEELVNDCKGGILLSGEYDTTLMKDEREFVLDLIHDKTLFIRPRDIQQIEEDYGSVAKYRKKMFGKTNVAVKNKGSGKGRLTNLQKCLAMQRITLRQKVKK